MGNERWESSHHFGFALHLLTIGQNQSFTHPGGSGIHSRLFFCYNSKVDSETPKPASKRSLLVTLCNECYEDDVLGQAAQLAFYFLFALFPMLIFLAALVGYLPIPHLLDRMMDYLSQVLPTIAIVLVRQTLLEITRMQRSGLLSFGFIVTVWAASSGLHALIYSLNVAYGVKITRPWWRDRLLAIGLTFGFSILIIVALALVFFGGNLGTFLANYYYLGTMFRTGWMLLQWPTMVLFVLLGLELLYFTAPHRPMRWRFPGAQPGADYRQGGGWLDGQCGLASQCARSEPGTSMARPFRCGLPR